MKTCTCSTTQVGAATRSGRPQPRDGPRARTSRPGTTAPERLPTRAERDEIPQQPRSRTRRGRSPRTGLPDGRAALSRGAESGAARGDAPRRARDADRRGHRRVRRRLQGDRGLLEEFGERRVRDTPISENTIVGMGVGAAMTGLRPVVELMTINFALLAFDQIVNHAAAHPLHVRRPGHGAARRAHAPGRRPPARPDPLALPRGAVPARARPARRGALDARRREGPAEDARSATRTRSSSSSTSRSTGCAARCPTTTRTLVGFGRARIAREGADVTIVGVSRMALTAERAADTLAQRARRGGRGDRPAHAAPARPRHDPRVGRQDQPLRDRRGGLAARRRRREPRGADLRAGLRRPRRARAARERRGRADALLQAARGHRLPARAAGRAALRSSRRARGVRYAGAR